MKKFVPVLKTTVSKRALPYISRKPVDKSNKSLTNTPRLQSSLSRTPVNKTERSLNLEQ